jgi:predicted deacylase
MHVTNRHISWIGIGSITLLFAVVYFVLQKDTSLSYEVVPPVNSVEVVTEKTLPTFTASSDVKEKFFGYSTKGRSLYGYEIGTGKETVFLFGAIHGDEKNTADLLNKFVEEIKANPESISDSKKLVVIPIANPDGYYERSDNLNINSVNLNRNFGTKEWKPYEQVWKW